ARRRALRRGRRGRRALGLLSPRITVRGSLALRPAGLLNRPRRPLSRGSDPASRPAGPLVSYQINRQLSGWNPPPQVTRAFGAHVESRKGAVALRLDQWLRFPSPL